LREEWNFWDSGLRQIKRKGKKRFVGPRREEMFGKMQRKEKIRGRGQAEYVHEEARKKTTKKNKTHKKKKKKNPNHKKKKENPQNPFTPPKKTKSTRRGWQKGKKKRLQSGGEDDSRIQDFENMGKGQPL